MFSKSNLLSTLAAGLFLFIGGYLIWGVLMVDFFAQHAGTAAGVEKEPNMLFIGIGCFLEAFFLSTLYSKWARGVHSAKGGFEFGAFVGAIIGFGEGLIWYATTNLSDLTATLTSGVLNVIFVGIAGSIIATVYKTANK